MLEDFPRSQHRPVLLQTGKKIFFAQSKQKPIWNFTKADWFRFDLRVDAAIRFVPCTLKNYGRFLGVIKSAAKSSIPRGFRKKYIPGWTPEMDEMLREFEESGDPEIGDELLELLMAAKRTKWEKSTSEMNFKHSSRKSWNLMRKLGDAVKPAKINVNIDQEKIAAKIKQNLVNSMLSNRFYRVFVGESSSRYRKLNDGFAQGGCGSPDYFNIYISDMPETMSRKFPFADDLALATQTVDLKDAEEILTNDMATMDKYYTEWRLCLNAGKTESCIFHLNNQMADAELDIRVGGEKIRHNKNPKYLGTYLERPLTYQKNSEVLSQKLKTRNNLLRKLAGTGWGANGHTLRITALALVYSTAEYAAPVWYKSAHVDKIDCQLNETMRIITASVQSTPLPWLPVLANIAPPALRREEAAHKNWFQLMNHPEAEKLPIVHDLMNPPPHRLKSRHPIWKDPDIQFEGFSIKERWRQKWEECPNFENKSIIEDPTDAVPGLLLPRKDWKTLNRLRTGHGCCGEKMFLWKYSDTPVCDCDNVSIQSMGHIINDCVTRRFPGGISELHSASTDSIVWVRNLDLNL